MGQYLRYVRHQDKGESNMETTVITVQDLALVLSKEDPTKKIKLSHMQKKLSGDDTIAMKELVDKAKRIVEVREMDPDILRQIVQNLDA